jgi:hypothetical protein
LRGRKILRGTLLTRRIAILVVSIVLAGCATFAAAQAAPPKPAIKAPVKQVATPILLPPSPKALLPDEFDGWEPAEPAKTVTDLAQVDPANAAALREYDFNFAVLASYKREGQTLTIHALGFDDTSGAYGAYTYYRQNGWPKEAIGAGATSNHNRVLFWRGATVVDATFSQIGPMSAGELREIANHLPLPDGNKAIAPPILAFLPPAELDGQTTHYAEGPAGYQGSGGVLPPGLVGFDRSAETVTANYSLTSGLATLTLIEYPTPQIAQSQEASIRAYIKAGSQAQPPWPKPLTDSDLSSLEVRRSGVLVVLVSGDAIPEESHRLLESVHYEANLTSVSQPVDSEILKTSRLLIGIATLVVVGSIAAILLGFFLGGGRALYRMARGRPVSSVYDEEFIHLDLQEKWKEGPVVVKGTHSQG